MLLGLQKRHDFLETLATLQVSIHDDICFKAALLFLFYGVRRKCPQVPRLRTISATNSISLIQ